MYTAEMMCIEGYRRLDKRVARRLYNEGKTIYMVPCNCSIYGIYTVVIGENKYGYEEDRRFDSVVNGFEFYCCNTELGKYPMYFIKEAE